MTENLSFDAVLHQPLDRAIETVTGALKEEGFGVLTRIDVHKAFEEKLGVEFRPYVILGACSPPLAHAALSREPLIGLLLPCNVTVERRVDGVLVRIVDPRKLLSFAASSAESELREVAEDASARLSRVAARLART